MIDELAAHPCTLDAAAKTERARRWRALLERAITEDEDGLHFPRELEVARELAELAVLESDCCGAQFTLDVRPDGVSLALRR